MPAQQTLAHGLLYTRLCAKHRESSSGKKDVVPALMELRVEKNATQPVARVGADQVKLEGWEQGDSNWRQWHVQSSCGRRKLSTPPGTGPRPA